jgi:hypothetical protein
VVGCPPSSSGTHTSIAVAATGVRRPTTAYAPTTATASALQQEFAMKDLGELHHFLGMHVQHCGDGLLLSQEQYMLEILD